MRKYYLTAGWKMNLGVIDSINYAQKLKQYVNSIPDLNKNLKLVIFTDLLSLYSVSKVLYNTRMEIGSPDLFWEDSGAFTGEVSPLFLSKIGCSNVLIGHPERIINLKEDSRMINKKVKAALRNNITPFLIISEKRGTNKEKVLFQVRDDFLNYTEALNAEEISKIVIIYEPLWAINTTEAASANYIVEMVSDFRNFLNKEFGSQLGDNMDILYGGGVNIKNFKCILEVERLNGIGIGKASLDFNFFTSCIDVANHKLNKE